LDFTLFNTPIFCHCGLDPVAGACHCGLDPQSPDNRSSLFLQLFAAMLINSTQGMAGQARNDREQNKKNNIYKQLNLIDNESE
jgi:hypothetical protein